MKINFLFSTTRSQNTKTKINFLPLHFLTRVVQSLSLGKNHKRISTARCESSKCESFSTFFFSSISFLPWMGLLKGKHRNAELKWKEKIIYDLHFLLYFYFYLIFHFTHRHWSSSEFFLFYLSVYSFTYTFLLFLFFDPRLIIFFRATKTN